jgi:hypothetical protein
MRRPAAWVLGAFAAARLLRRRKQATPPPPPETGPDPRAEELRRKLAESRGIVAEREEFEAAETTVDQAQAPAPGDPEVRRRAVHDAGRAAAERMRER